MKMRKLGIGIQLALLAGIVYTLLLITPGVTVFGETQQQSSSPGKFFKMPMSGISGDNDYLYVMAGGKIMAYQKGRLTLSKTVELPDLPADMLPPKPDFSSGPPPFPPPPGGPPHGLWVSDQMLYVLAGPMMYQYSTPDLSLITSKALPKPEFP